MAADDRTHLVEAASRVLDWLAVHDTNDGHDQLGSGYASAPLYASDIRLIALAATSVALAPKSEPEPLVRRLPAGDVPVGYRWVIERDFISGGADKGRTGTNCAHDAQGVALLDALVARRAWALWRLFDDDGELYYEGYLVSTDDTPGLGQEHFAPLDDFGRPNAGCTTIKYLRTDGEWEEL